MAKETIDVLIEGGKATAAPPLGPALGPMGVPIADVVGQINAKTKEFAGMKVPVKVIIDKDTKAFDIKIGTPPASALIKKEAGIKKAAANPTTDMVADLKIEQIIKIAKMKTDSLLGKDSFSQVKEIMGTCNSMGVMVEGKRASQLDVEPFRQKIISGKTELTAEELKEQEEEKIKLKEEMEAKREEYEATAKEILAKMAGKERNKIKEAMVEAELPTPLIEEMLPAEEKKAEEGSEEGKEAKPEEKKE